jgi:preprotein translocase subunit SecA
MSDLSLDTNVWLLPPPLLFPERAARKQTWLTPLETAVSGVPMVHFRGLQRLRLSRIVALVDRWSAIADRGDDAALRGEAETLRLELRRSGFTDQIVARAFALIRATAMRTIGLRHFDVQLLGGFALVKGMIAEMATGEGKTLTATLAAGTAALASTPVHVVTVNDYLARRDAETMGPIYRALGVSVGVVVHGMKAEERRAAYACDVTYCSNKEIAFDYLRDRIVLGRRAGNIRLKLEKLYGGTGRCDRVVMRGLHLAIVDEADSVLIDEARTPLIISKETDPGDAQHWAEEALELIVGLEPKRDYQILKDERRVELTDGGKDRLAALGEERGGIWRSRMRREEAARQALCAVHLFHRGEQYLVRDDKVQIVDEYSGRIMPDRSWSEGLHQLIEVKEGCPVTGHKAPIARISYQRFFRRYRHLAGMTGTAQEVTGELWNVYRIAVVTIPTNRRLQRKQLRPRIHPTLERKWQAIATRVAELNEWGRPVLIGTRSVAASETLSQCLSERGLAHVVLNAAQDRDEAEIIANAGQKGQVTVATNMAGRGVDILLGEGVAALGGLHVILSERHDAGRIDRQLAGRAGRHGEPGSNEAVLSLEDPLLDILGSSLTYRLATFSSVFAGRLFQRAQRKAERGHSRMRRELLKLDHKLGTLLAFAGESE